MNTQPTGHAGTSGLQRHSLGDTYPFLPFAYESSNGLLWGVLNLLTGRELPVGLDTSQQAHAWARDLKESLS
jgi:hypothetical protein